MIRNPRIKAVRGHKEAENPDNKTKLGKYAKMLPPVIEFVALLFLSDIASYIVSATGTETLGPDTHPAAKLALNFLSIFWQMRNVIMQEFTYILPGLPPETAQFMADGATRVITAISVKGTGLAVRETLANIIPPFARQKGKK